MLSSFMIQVEKKILNNGIITKDLSKEEEPSTCSKVGDMVAWFTEEKGNVNIKQESTKLSLNCII